MDQVVIFNERHLRHVLAAYVDYYHRARTHLSLDKDCPRSRPIQPPRAAESSLHRKSAGCTIATSASRPDGTDYCLPLVARRPVTASSANPRIDGRLDLDHATAAYRQLAARVGASRLVALDFHTRPNFCWERIFSRDNSAAVFGKLAANFSREARCGAGARARNPQGRDADHRQLREKGGGLYQADRRARVPRLGLTVFPGRATIREKVANASAG